MANPRQLSFEAGELADKLHGRSDLDLYWKGLRTCRNFYPTVDGQLVSRPGSMLVAETKGSYIAAGAPGSAANTKVRLIPFVFGDGQSYVLEFGHLYVRFHTNGGTIESAPAVPLEIASPYGWSELRTLQFAQVGNIMVLTHRDHDAQVLERTSHTVWTLGPQDYTVPAWPGLPYLEPRLDPVTFKGFSGYMSEPMIQDSADFAGDATHPAREWIYALTADGQNLKTGKRFETKPFIVTKKYNGVDTYPAVNGTVAALADHQIAVYKDKKVVISAYRFNIGTAPDFILLGLNIYRGRGGDFYGLIGRTLNSAFVDVGDEPNYAIQPPLGTNPFEVLDAQGNVQRIEKPIAVAFYGDRLVYGGAWDNDKLIRAATMFFSALGQWTRFDRYKIPLATQALEFDLALTTRQEVRTIYAGQKLLIGTDSAVHSMWGAGGAPLAGDSLPDVRTEAHIGTSHLRFLAVRGVPVFAETDGGSSFAGGVAVHALKFTDGYGEYKNVALSSHASHLLYGDGGGVRRLLVDWAYAARPWQLVWAVRADGVLLSLTFNTETGKAGWARHDTDGAYENVCVVPEGTEDRVYVVVNRQVDGQHRRYIERLTSRSRLGGSITSVFPAGVSQDADDICVDCALRYQGPAVGTLAGLDYLEGKTNVWVLREGLPPLGPFTVTGGQVQLRSSGYGATTQGKLTYAGLLYTPEMETLAVGGEREHRKILKGLVLEVKDTRGLRVGNKLEDSALKPVKQLKPAIGYAPIANDTREIIVPTTGDWNEHARAAIRQDLPLPCTIVGLTRLVETGGSSP